MEIVIALVSLYCNNNFNYKGCVDQKRTCVEDYVSRSLNKPRFYVYDKKILTTKETKIIAEGYTYCTSEFDGYSCN